MKNFDKRLQQLERQKVKRNQIPIMCVEKNGDLFKYNGVTYTETELKHFIEIHSTETVIIEDIAHM